MKWQLDILQNLAAEKHVAGAALPPTDYGAGSMLGPVAEPPLDDPSRRIVLKVRFHRPQDARSPVMVATLHELRKPVLRRKLVVIDEGYELTVGIFQRLVPHQRYILPRLDAIDYFKCRLSSKPDNHVPGRLFGVIVRDDDRKSEQIGRMLIRQRIEQAHQEADAPIRADADSDVTCLTVYRRFQSRGDHAFCKQSKQSKLTSRVVLKHFEILVRFKRF